MHYYESAYRYKIETIEFLLKRRTELERELMMEVKPKPQFGFVSFSIETYRDDEDVLEIIKELDTHNFEELRKAYRVIFCGEEPEPVKTISLSNEGDVECLVRYFSAFRLDLPERIYVSYGLMAHKHFFTVGRRGFNIYTVEDILQNRDYVARHITNCENKERFLRLCQATERFVKYNIAGEERVVRKACQKFDEINKKVFDELSKVAGVDLVMEYLLEVYGVRNHQRTLQCSEHQMVHWLDRRMHRCLDKATKTS